MTFGPDHYVPVVKVKQGEKKALAAIASPRRAMITPLLEIVERKDKTTPAHLDTAFKGLADAVRGYRRCLLDTRELEADGPSVAAEVFRRADEAGMVFTPVTGISRSADVAAALAHGAEGLAVRLTRKEFEDGSISHGLSRFLSRHGLVPEQVDLIVDLGPVDELIRDGVANLTKPFLADVPDHGRWRTLTVSACAFPQSMARVQGKSEERVERTEWLAWRELHANRTKLLRLPTFSDCGIQHPAGVEGFDFRVMQVSAAIRYALPDSWLLIKGESTKNVPAAVQFPDLAVHLVHGRLHADFAGSAHCAGCSSIAAAADGAEGLGSADVWRRLGTIHHFTRTAADIHALPWP